MFSKQLLHSSTIRCLLIALVLCGITLIGSRSTGQVKAATMAQSAPNAPTDRAVVHCTVLYVGVDSNNVTVHSLDCLPSTGQFIYFDVPTNSKMANQVLSIALTAQTINKKMTLVYEPNENSRDPIHRTIVGFGLDLRQPASN